MRSRLPAHCQHYRCRRTDVAPVIYSGVVGATFARWLCPLHVPALTGPVSVPRIEEVQGG